ncbi:MULTISPECIES: protein-L-isoaspartate(D-aspartate) O-methyltransferase [Olivibacter]|uniref:Protein-L-isoaspartate O-methyltransferase n=1 Tax=Olivibacter oleidegradans TaxID=760123 RepID=A0ABV6HFV0_9SPHI|nr:MULTISPECIES: protein-L-isoaspartate(D-aspartate) O-methyltransferase [Olivibacter]MDM8177626.1 protein-L-isoaspartate(D-aspartate) O-methyltransferase [Olivibacter sp. 47]QEL00069.1 protein-L-isoaspartate(D-aspartate) O-methyltransferase [Olivibacter sp. LS-1]
MMILVLLCTYTLLQSNAPQDYKQLREKMVIEQLEARGIHHDATLQAMRQVERHLFVPSPYQSYAYEDRPLPIGFRQTISQPFIVASMTQMLDLSKDDRVLEIGTGSGYQAAVLAEIVAQVYTIEIVKELAECTKKLLHQLNYNNIEVVIGDGYQGLRSAAPFDAIIVTAAPEKIPEPLVEQLKDGGKMIIPIGPTKGMQTLKLLKKKKGKLVVQDLMHVRFVPFTRKNR